MAFGINTRMSLEMWNILTGASKSTRSFGVHSSGQNSNSGGITPIFSDSLAFQAGDTVIKLAVRKMQEAINRPVQLANGQTFNGVLGNQTNLAQLRTTQTLESSQLSVGGSFRIFQPLKQPEATSEQIEQGVANAGGREALSPWLVDGKTKIDVDGRSMVAQVDPSSGAAATDPKTAAAAALARFGLGADRLDGNFDQLRSDLRQAAAEAQSANDPSLSRAIEYALEDAFAKVRTVEDVKNGVSPTAFEDQLAKNKEQGASIMDQLQLGAGSSWAMDSAAEDLAVFGKDMTALGKMSGLAGELDKIYQQKVADLKNRYVGTEFEYINEMRRLDGALSRLQNGIDSSSATVSASASVSSSVTVTIDGVAIDASSVVSVVTVIADPLVFDLNGDGIDLKSAEEGVDFDMDGDGQKTRTGFIQGDDAFLFYNESGEDKVTDGRQLFGNADGYANGFEKLRSFDDNADGVIDENDEIYGKLRLWQDKNGDGACDDDEVTTLAGAGVESIRVDYENVREEDGKGNLIGQTGSFTRTDGSQGYAADVWFKELANRL